MQLAFCVVKFFTVLGCFLLARPSKVVLGLLIPQMVLDFLAGAALADLIVYHCYLRYKRLTTYEHILMKRRKIEERRKDNKGETANTAAIQSESSAREKSHKQTPSEAEGLTRSMKPESSGNELTTSTVNLSLRTEFSAGKQIRPGKFSEVAPDHGSLQKQVPETNIHTPARKLDDYSFDYEDNIFNQKTQINNMMNSEVQNLVKKSGSSDINDTKVKRELFAFKEEPDNDIFSAKGKETQNKGAD